jgi:single-stranded-DNA-specific exonuclease
MSVLGKKWSILASQGREHRPILDVLLENRGLKTKEEQEAFLNLDQNMHDPHLMKDMQKSIDRIKKAIDQKERIMIFGDYDVDGLTSAAILFHTLKELGAEHSIRLPHREKDGYGLNKNFIDEFEKLNIKLIITVDCGISCADEITYAKEKGIDTIITDHHQIPEKFPHDAYSINHPKQEDCAYPFDDLTGAGVALKLAHALYQDHTTQEEAPAKIENLLEFAALGTIADLGQVQGENRIIINKGLKNITNTKWPGLKILKELTGGKYQKSVDTWTVGYQLAPRLNAAGRIGDPVTALHLLIGSDPTKLHQYGKELETLNEERKKMTFDSYGQAKEIFEPLEARGKLPYILVAHHPEWHVGILGLSASRLADQFGRPAIVMQDLGETLVGSARSIEAFHILEAIAQAKDLLINFGGHKEAAGFTIPKENLKQFKEILEKHAKKVLREKDLRPSLNIDCELQADDVSDGLIKDIHKLRPFGVRNHRPLFKLSNVKPLYPKTVGRNEDHLKFDADLGSQQIPAIAFRLGKHMDALRKRSEVSIVFHVEVNEWNGIKKLQLEVIDFA